MAENLGQSQVLPYLRGLARRGVTIDLVSFELATLAPSVRDELAAELENAGLRWHPLVRTIGTPLHVKIAEAATGVRTALRQALSRHPDIVHGRSYFATAIGDAIGVVMRRSKLLFDCRGMIGDEYVDCGHWTTDRLEYRLVKGYERRLFRHSDGVVVLTRALAHWLREHRVLGRGPSLAVIPCCVDLAKFQPSDEARVKLRAELGLGDALTMIYAGSLGTWYLEPEMAAFAAAVRRHADRRCAFVCLTPSDASGLRAKLEKVGFDGADIIVRRVPPKEMPAYLSVGDLGLSFIQSCFSKKGSSPTKVAEYLACGNVVVVNGDIGDQADLRGEDACIVTDDFSPASIDDAARAAVSALARPRAERLVQAVDVARRHFGLEEVGVARYAKLYETLARV